MRRMSPIHGAEDAMRMTLAALGMGSLALLLSGTTAGAQNYPWCARYFGRGGTNCGFVSYEQCMATARGAGAFCDRNSMYQPPGAAYPAPRRAYVRRHHRY
jgi:hypothetical protein